MQALAAGAQDLGFPAVAHGMFPKGGMELVEHCMHQCDAHMATELAGQAFDGVPVNDRISIGVQARLRPLMPYIRTWPEAMAMGALPQNLPTVLSLLGRTVDEIWYRAGDRSTDVNWYTRRGLLLSVYVSTELFMVSDHSEGFRDTWSFLENRLKDVAEFGGSVGHARAIGDAVCIGVKSLGTAGLSLATSLFPGAR